MKSFILKHKIGTSIGAIIVLFLAWFLIAKKNGATYQFVSVTQGTITEIVSVTGATTPVESLDLAFQTGGTIAAVYKNAGDTVSQGDVLVRLDTSDLSAQLAQAKASVDAAQATLANLQAGPTPQNVQVSQTAVTTAQQNLANSYATVANTVIAAYAKANDAIRNQITAFYTDPESNNPQLTFTISDNQVLNNAQFDRIQASEELNEWQTELNALNLTSPTSTLDAALISATKHLSVIENLLTVDSSAVVDATNLSATTAASYKTSLTNAITEVDAAASAVSSASQSIASENVAITQAQAQLSVTLAGSTAQSIAAQQAQVEAAQANEQGIQVKINEASLTSPINGVVTVQNAKVGEIAAAGQTITSIISSNNLEIDADVPETDIGKVAVGNAVTMTFDAFPGQTFTGKVFYIDPAETIISGVVDYEIKVSVDNPNPNIKSGLTANLNIQTQTNANALILPQYAVVENASGTFVDVLQNGKLTQIPVTLGIQDQSGNVEIKSGVTAGEQVINIGLKAQ